MRPRPERPGMSGVCCDDTKWCRRFSTSYTTTLSTHESGTILWLIQGTTASSLPTASMWTWRTRSPTWQFDYCLIMAQLTLIRKIHARSEMHMVSSALALHLLGSLVLLSLDAGEKKDRGISCRDLFQQLGSLSVWNPGIVTLRIHVQETMRANCGIKHAVTPLENGIPS